jgi:RimJ/RimL family protein N-acetyltransferase
VVHPAETQADPLDPPPERIELDVADGCALRRWRIDDVDAQVQAINECLDHLRPWMAWAREPVTPATQGAYLGATVELWDRGVDFGFAVVDGADRLVIGGCGLHRRVGPGALEIGYWVHVDWTGRGIATAAAAALTRAALATPGIDRVVIRHEVGNLASEAVPRRLGYRCDGTGVPDDGPTAGRPTTTWSITA